MDSFIHLVHIISSISLRVLLSLGTHLNLIKCPGSSYSNLCTRDKISKANSVLIFLKCIKDVRINYKIAAQEYLR